MIQVDWTGDLGTGTSGYRAYKRDHEISVFNRPPILASSDASFRGDPSRYNPEEMLVASLSSCHMLWYLHLCADAGIVVTSYHDDATGTMTETEEGGGQFTAVLLRPRVRIKAGGNRDLATSLHERARHLCFVANSVNFPVACQPVFDES